MPKDSDDPRTPMPRLRKPVAADGVAIWELVKACKPLDENSLYCNLIQAEHFRDTCVLAEIGGNVVGWVSGHMIPGRGELFVWQVAVSPKARGIGLGRAMLLDLIKRDACGGATHLKTTITRDNAASWALFRGLARGIGAAVSEAPHFERDAHFEGRHDTEHMVTIALPDAKALARVA